MSGHSKWAKIKRDKGANDAARGAIFTKIGRLITMAAAEGGSDPSMNFPLRLAMEKAKQANMPSANVERAIKKGTGEIEGGARIESITYEGYAPAGVAILVDVQTDNTNRSVSEVKNIIETAGGKFGGSGSVSWMFEEKGLVVVIPARLRKSQKYGESDSYEPADKSEIELELLEIDGIEDIVEGESEDEEGKSITTLEVITAKNDLAKVRGEIEKMNVQIDNAELIKIPKDKVAISDADKGKVNRLIENLEEHEDVQNVWINADL